MGQFPTLNQEDITEIESAMRDLLTKSEANIALLVEKAGYLIHQCGNPDQLDTTTFATLGSNAYNAVQFMANLVNESNFTSMYQQGESFSTLMLNVDERPDDCAKFVLLLNHYPERVDFPVETPVQPSLERFWRVVWCRREFKSLALNVRNRFWGYAQQPPQELLVQAHDRLPVGYR